MLNRLITILSVLILLTLAAMGGYYFGFKSSLSQTSYNRTTSSAALSSLPDNIIKAQYTIVSVQIISHNQNNLTFRDKSGRNFTFPFTPYFNILAPESTNSAKPPNATKSAALTTDQMKQTIKNQQAIISLMVSGNSYQVNSIISYPEQ